MDAVVNTDQHPWSEPGGTIDAMAHISTDMDDLSNIFNINDFDLDAIQNVNAGQQQQQQQQQYIEAMHTSHAETHPNTPFLDNVPQSTHAAALHDFGEHASYALGSDVDTRQQYDGHDEQQQQHGANMYSGNAIYHAQIPQHFSQVQQSSFSVGAVQQHYTSAGQIPPTPNSYEMHGEAGRFLHQQQQQQQQHSLFEQQKHMRKLEQHRNMHQHAQFTPMASPDGTPQYAIQSEFTTPGAYFSPLTSPALHAQLQPTTPHSLLQQAQGYFPNPNTAPNSNAPSPVDLNNGDVEMTDSLLMLEPNARRARRKMVTPRSVGGPISSRPRQSPIQKAQKRKSGLLTTIIPPKELDKIIMIEQQHLPGSAASHRSHTFDSSESGSISPEPLSEALMGPPPRPSPSLNAQFYAPKQPQKQTSMVFNKAAAATPKSILSMRSHQQYDAASKASNSPILSQHASLEQLELPEAASKQPQQPSLSDIDVAAAERSSARKTPKLGPLSTAASLSTRLDSASASPITSFSPSTAGTILLKDKKSESSSRTTKKRSSTITTPGSALASPALRPRISPSIKPLLPEGSNLHSPTHALLLASKSNYQNLLEGNHLPGVSYPDSLSTGLTSKRTSHKVAEQGRRNRINEALKEMQSLIPSPSILAKQQSSEDVSGSKDEEGSADADDCKDSKESAAAKSNSSKAATVESANRYIRLLKESDASQRAAILALKKENEAIRRRLALATGAPDTEMASIEEVDMQTPDDSSD